MTNLTLTKPSDYERVMLYGAPKTGKTNLAAQLAEHFRLTYVDLENGHNTLYQLPIEWQKKINLINLPDTRSFPVAAETCLKLVKATTVVEICDLHGKIGCMLCRKTEKAIFSTFDPTSFTKEDIIIFDSATQLTNSIIAHITRNEKEDYKLDWDDWGRLGGLMDMFYSHIQQAKFHCIVISHEADVKLEEKGKSQLVPVSGTRNFSRNVGKYFDHIVYCQRKNMKHVFTSMTTDHIGVLTGSRTNIDLQNMKEASLLDIFQQRISKPKLEFPSKGIKVLSKLSTVLKNKS